MVRQAFSRVIPDTTGSVSKKSTPKNPTQLTTYGLCCSDIAALRATHEGPHSGPLEHPVGSQNPSGRGSLDYPRVAPTDSRLVGQSVIEQDLPSPWPHSRTTSN